MFAMRILRLMGRELRIIWTDWRLCVLVFIMPVAYTLLLGYLYLPRRVSEIPTYIVDQDHSQLSRSIVTSVERNETFRVVGRVDSVDDFRSAVQRREAYAAVWIPPHFERDIKKGRPVKLMTLVDGSNMLIANTALKGAARIGGTYSAGVELKRLNMRGAPSRHTMGQAMPVEMVTRTWYNPTYNYNTFIMIGLMAAVVQQIALLGCALAFSHEREHGLVPGIFRITESPLEVLTAKGILYTAINMVTAFAAFGVGVARFGLVMHGSLWLMALLLFIFITAIVALGIAVSAVCGDSVFATEALMLVSLPSFLLCGFTWPTFSMIPAIKVISWVLPLTHFAMPLRSVFMQEAGFDVIRDEVLWLWTLAALSYIVAYVVIWRVMARERPVLQVMPA